MEQPIIQIKNVTKTFQTRENRVEALKNINLEINKGDIYGIIGMSGAGKSTLVRCLNFLEKPTGGTVLIEGQDLSACTDKELRKVRNSVAMIFQHFNLLMQRTVLDNVCFSLEILGMKKKEAREKARDLLKIVDLEAKADAYPAQLSGGQKQRVAIARSLAMNPKILLCDEATSALDPQTTQSILKLLKQVNETLGITIVLITHEMAVVKDICDRVAVMERGSVVEEGDTVSVFSHPKEEMTKNFIDTANSLSKIHELIAEGHSLTELKPGDKMVLLTYSGGNAGEPLISAISSKFGVSANIIYGNIDYLKGKPLGKLVVTLSGEAPSMEDAIAYIRSLGVEMEVIKE